MVLGQPNFGNLLSAFRAEIAEDGYTRYSELRILVAYAKMSGVRLLLDDLSRFRSVGGSVEVVLGIGQKNTSKEAVEALCEAGAKVAILHNPSALQRTFHPKAYLLRGRRAAWSSVGSSNLTAGGLETNYEWNVVERYNLNRTLDSNAFKDILRTFARFTPRGASSAREVSRKLIEALHEKGVLPSEEELRKASAKARVQASAVSLRGLFGQDKLPAPSAKSTAAGGTAKSGTPASNAVNRGNAGAARAPIATSSTGFWTRLSAWDVNTKSSPGQILIPKECWSLFPRLGRMERKPTGSKQAEARLDVIFRNGKGAPRFVAGARQIRYVPASKHGRKNTETRFTFLQRPGVFDTLRQGDVLEFRRTSTAGAWFEVTRITKTEARSRYVGKHGFL